MKTLKFNEKEYKAEKIIKTSNAIIGQDTQGNQIFTFRGVSDFSLFELEEGQNFDVGENDVLDDYILDLEFRLSMLEIGGMQNDLQSM